MFQCFGTVTVPSTPIKGTKNDDVPESLDWRDEGIVTDVKQQGSCGSCWSFSVAAVLESLYAKTEGITAFSLSQQCLMDCCTDCYGCGGGDPQFALNMLLTEKWNGKLPKLDDYPYLGYQSTCHSVENMYGSLAKWGWVNFFDEEDMKVKCAAYGPISALQKSNVWSYVFYSGGIFRVEGCSQLDFDHAVTVVGYGSEGGDEYWLIKNSGGTAWGEDGYMRLARNEGNMCGIASRSIYVDSGK